MSVNRNILKSQTELSVDHDFSICLGNAAGASINQEALKRLIDMIEINDVTLEQAIVALNKRISHDDPCIVTSALKILKVLFHTCGSKIHKVIVTDDYMNFLKSIIDSSKNQSVRDMVLEIVEDWFETLKYLPKKDAPLKLIKTLQGEGYVFPKIQGHLDEAEKLESDIKIKSNNEKTPDTIDKQEIYKKQLEEVKERQRLKYKQFRKANNLPTSSDEEDVFPQNQFSVVKSEIEQSQNKILPKELEAVKNQRLRLRANVRKFREEKHQNFFENGNNCDFQQCQGINCMDCQEYKNKSQPEDVVIPKQLPKVFQKIKESRAIIKSSIEEVKELKRHKYYSNSTSTQNKTSLPSNGTQVGHKLGGVPPSEVETLFHNNKISNRIRSRQEEDEDLRRALEISVYDTGNGSSNPYEDDDYDEDYNKDELQQVLDISLLEAENINFSPMTKQSSEEEDELQLIYAKQLSLKANGAETDSECEDENERDSCVICFNIKLLKTFHPCNHKCICKDCIPRYNLRTCPICRVHFSLIL